MNFTRFAFQEDFAPDSFEKIRKTKPQEGQRDPKRDKKRSKDFSKERQQKRNYE